MWGSSGSLNSFKIFHKKKKSYTTLPLVDWGFYFLNDNITFLFVLLII